MTLFQIAYKNVARDKHNYLAYYMSSAFTVFIFFLFGAAVFHPDLSVIQTGSTLSMALFAGNVVIYLFAFLFVGYSAVSFIKARGKQLGVYAIIGMSQKQMRRMLFTESMLVGFLAILTGIAGGSLFLGLFLKLIRNILSDGNFGLYVPGKAILLTFALFAVLFLGIGCAAPRFISGRKVVLLLKSDQSYAKELALSPIRLVLTALTGAAVLLLANAAMADQLGIFWIALMLICIMLFSYLLITQGGAVLFAVRKRSRSHFKGIHLLSDAETSSLMRENGQVMALNCILMTLGFLAVVLLGSMKNNVMDEVKAILPFPYLYLSYDDNTRSVQDTAVMDEALAADGTCAKVEYTLLYHPFTDAFIKASDFEQITGKDMVPLKENEVLMLPGSLKNKELPIEPYQQTKEMFAGLGLKLKKAGQTGQLVSITGAYSQVSVVNDRTWENIKSSYLWQEELSAVRVTAYQDPYWVSHLDRSDFLEDALRQDEDNYDYSYTFVSLGNYYQVETLVKSLMVFVGVSVSILFLFASASIVYFRLYTTLERERKKYSSIRKLGFSNRELRTTIRKQLSAILLWPFVMAMLLMYGGTLLFQSQGLMMKPGQVILYSVVFLFLYGSFSAAVIKLYSDKIECGPL